MVRTVKHVFDKQRALDIVNIEDGHGRQHEIQVSPLTHPDTQAFIDKEIAAFAAQEAVIADHIAKHFNPETLERKSS